PLPGEPPGRVGCPPPLEECPRPGDVSPSWVNLQRDEVWARVGDRCPVTVVDVHHVRRLREVLDLGGDRHDHDLLICVCPTPPRWTLRGAEPECQAARLINTTLAASLFIVSESRDCTGSVFEPAFLSEMASISRAATCRLRSMESAAHSSGVGMPASTSDRRSSSCLVAARSACRRL